MKNTKFSHKAIALTLLLAFLPSLIPVNYLLASNNGPTAPETASFEPVDATDMVNLATGDLSYVMPLLNIPSPEGGYPLALSYHAGIAMDQEASWVGLGWTLNPGAINRYVSGVPDDWKRTKKYSIVYDAGGVSTSISVGSSFGQGLRIGEYTSYSSNKAFGGETTYSLDRGVSSSLYGVLNGRAGTDGVGLSVNLPLIGLATRSPQNTDIVLGVSAYKSFKNGRFSVNGNLSLSNGSTQVSLASDGSLSVGALGYSVPLAGSNGLSLQSHMNHMNLFVSIPIGYTGFNLDLGYTKTRYWVFDNDFSIYNGSLYAGDIGGLLNNAVLDNKVGLDSYEGLFKYNQSQQQRTPNFSYISYDNYRVLAQGLSGSISPKILEEGSLIRPEESVRSGNTSFPKAFGFYDYPNSAANNFSKTVANQGIHFYFDNEYSSHLKVNSGNWNVAQSNTSYTGVEDFESASKAFESTINLGGQVYDSYNSSNKRMRKGNFVETFTNQDIINNPASLLEPSVDGFNRSQSWVPADGIGGYKITAVDGKVYHYAIPVYQKEQFSRTIPIDEDSELKFREEQQFDPYATHWLLTAVTGPDYIDENGNNKADDGDYGYWVEFEYGKWSDGYVWRTPNTGFNSSEKVKSYSWGIKEVYYLDKAKTRSHTALFVKGLRKDNLSSEILIANPENLSQPRTYTVPYNRGMIKGDDDDWYFEGMYENQPVPTSLPPAYYYGSSEFKVYAETYEQRSLRLEKVILLKNENAALSKTNPSASQSKFVGSLYVGERQTITPIIQGLPYNHDITVVEDHDWYGEYFNNVLDKTDVEVNNATILQNAQKVIEFGYEENYPLSTNSSNSLALSKGKLTLQSVSSGGKGGAFLIPPYTFDYYGKNVDYSKNQEDIWGYHKTAPMNWSLSKVHTPTGGEINIVYESDYYAKEAAIHRYVFDHNIQVKFTGTGAGSKTISFRNDPLNTNEEDTDFTQFFTAGQTTQIDVQYWLNPNQPGTNWIADIAANCTVDNVTSNEVRFVLPTNSTMGTYRNESTCSEEDWVFYETGEYNHVVDETVGWLGPNNPSSCESPVDGQYKLRFRFYSNKDFIESNGGGLRVKEIGVSDGSKTYKTKYSYLNPDTNQESGVTSYAPSKKEKEISYLTEIPNPGVMYEYVTVEEVSTNNQVNYKNRYHFEVPQSMVVSSSGATMGEAFAYTILQDESKDNVSLGGETVDMRYYKVEVKDNISSLGRLLSKESYNSTDQLLSRTSNNYLSYANAEIDQGVLQETFSSYKKLLEEYQQPSYLLSSSRKITVPNVLSSTTTTEAGHSITTTFGKHDFLTGSVLETTISKSDGTNLKTEIVPAYHRYSELGSKADLGTYENMLTQQAMTKSFVEHNGSWEETGVGITTWNEETYSYSMGGLTILDDVWRTHKTFAWDGQVDGNGLLSDFTGIDDGGFVWNNANAVQPSQWDLVSETTMYNNFSNPLEVVDINGNEAATKMGDGDEKVFATGTAAYSELFYSGAEDLESNGIDFGGGVKKGNATITNDSHTGNHALQLSAGQTAFEVTVDNGTNPERKYKISLWAKADNYANTALTVGATNYSTPSEEVRAGEWMLLNFYVPINGQQNVKVTATGSGSIVDDFRVHPIDATVTSYVYNQWDELTHILGPNNLGVQYEYDEAGRLKKILSEVQDFNGTGTGGFLRTSENDYTYKY